MASTHTDGPAMGTFVPDTVVYESDVEDDQEVDQLDSDTEPEENADAAQQPAAKNGAAPKVVKPRNPGHSLVSLTRIENMVQSEGVTGSLALSKEGLFVVAMATELFIKRLAQAGQREASVHRKTMVGYNDMAMTAQQYQEFMFLRDTVPMPITLANAMNMRKKREALLLDENPALASTMVPTGSTATPTAYPDQASYAGLPKPPKRSRPSNGVTSDTGNGTPNASTSSSRYPRDSMHGIDTNHMPPPPQHLRWQSNTYLDQHPDGRRAPPANGLVSVHPPPTASSSNPVANGFSNPSTRPHAFVRQSVSPPYQNEDLSDRESHPPASVYTESQAPSKSTTPPANPPGHDGPDSPQGNGARPSSQSMSPATGAFARGAPAPAAAPSAFGRATQNPGRTIYSQSRPD